MTGARKQGKNVPKQISVIILATILLVSVLASIGAVTGNLGVGFLTPNPMLAEQEKQRFILEEHQAIAPLLKMHVHTLLAVSINEVPVVVPADVGIDPLYYRNHTLDEFGAGSSLMSPIHTHDSDGIIHIESTVIRSYTLGEFLDIWGLHFEGRTGILVVDDGKSLDLNYRSHVLRDGERLFLSIE